MVKLRMPAKALGIALALVMTAGGATVAAATRGTSAAAGSLPPGGTFGTPQPLSGVLGLGMTDPFEGLRVSCTSVGNCGAIGVYAAKPAAKGTFAQQEAFVVTETNGHWGKPQAVPGLAKVNTMGQVDGLRITCSAPGFCEAGGSYVSKITASSGSEHAFVVTQAKGVWGKAQKFGTSGLSAGANGANGLDTLTCLSAGNCVAGGDYGASQGSVPFIAEQKNGTWGKPQLIPGIAALLGSQQAVVSVPRAISCTDGSDCTVVGDYPAHGRDDAFLATETGGVWTDAAPLPGLAALQSTANNRYTDVDGLACDPAGANCTASGVFTNAQGNIVPFTLTKTNGTWGTVAQLPGASSLNLNSGAGAGVLLSCPAQANCTIATTAFTPASPSAPPGIGSAQVYVDSQVNGVWGTPKPLSGMPSAAIGGRARVMALACGAPGSCTIGGYFGNAPGTSAGFLAKETGSTWTGPRTVKLPAAINGTTQIGDLSCVAKGYCVATAFAQFPAKTVAKPTAYFVDEGAATKTTLKLSKATITDGKENAEKLTVTVSGPPGGKVVVSAGKTGLCAIVLTASGKPGTCTLTAKVLKPGSYRLVASYKGSAVYVASQSAPATLTVRK